MTTSAPTLDLRVPRLDVLGDAGDALVVVIEDCPALWLVPTPSATIDAQAATVSISTTTITLTWSAAQTTTLGRGSHAWLLTNSAADRVLKGWVTFS